MAIQDTINIAKVCVPLTIKAIVSGQEQDLKLPTKLAMAYLTLEDVLENNPTDEDLPRCANYLFAMCGGYAFEAQRLINGGGGGSIVPSGSTGALNPYPIDVTIDASHAGLTYYQDEDLEGVSEADLVEIVINSNPPFQKDVQFTFNSAQGKINFDMSATTGNVYTLQLNDKMTGSSFKPVNN